MDPIELAAFAARNVVAAAATDAWDMMKRGIARLLGRGDLDRERLTEQRLDRMYQQLKSVSGYEFELARADLEAAWRTRLVDLVEERPGVVDDLQTLMDQIRAKLPSTIIEPPDHSVVADRDVNVTASGGIAAGSIHGDVSLANPRNPGSAGATGSGSNVALGERPVVASGGVAVGELHYVRPVTASQPVRLDPRPSVLAGREDLLAEMDRRLILKRSETLPGVVALCGLGGAGKTSLALEFAYRHLAGHGVIWQLAAEEPTVLTAGFNDLAAALGVRGLLDIADPISQVHGALAVMPEDWLLLFDNVTDRSTIQRMLPPSGRGRVVITSQNPNWPPEQVLEVPVLDFDTAAAFLVNRAGAVGQEAGARKLAEELGGLPLALEQAAAYMRTTGRTITAYLDLFRRRAIELLARGEPNSYDKRVTTTWALAFDQVEQTSPQAVGLLRLVAFCAPEAIPLELLLKPYSELARPFDPEVEPLLRPLLDDHLVVDDAVGALRRYSLISAPRDSFVLVHRLVQAVTIAQLSTTAAMAWRRATAALIEAALPSGPTKRAVWPTYYALMPHALAVLDVHSAGMRKITSYLRSRNRRSISLARHPSRAGLTASAAEARDNSAELLVVHRRSLGNEHLETIGVRIDLAHWTGMAGDPANARDQYAELVELGERLFGSESRDTLSMRSALANWTGEAGDIVSARDQYAELVEIYERLYGVDDPIIRPLRSELARWTGEAGDPASARDQYAGLLRKYKPMFDVHDPFTTARREDLARWTGEAGDPASARDQYAGLLQEYERILPTDHRTTKKIRERLAYWTKRALREESNNLST